MLACFASGGVFVFPFGNCSSGHTAQEDCCATNYDRSLTIRTPLQCPITSISTAAAPSGDNGGDVSGIFSSRLLSDLDCSCLAYSCPVWPTPVLFGLFPSCLACSRPVWPAPVLFGLLPSCLACSCTVWPAPVLFGLLLYCLAYSCPVWPTPDPFGLLPSCLACSCPVWPTPVPFGLLLSLSLIHI